MTGQGTTVDSLLSGALGIGSKQIKSKVILDFTYYEKNKEQGYLRFYIL